MRTPHPHTEIPEELLSPYPYDPGHRGVDTSVTAAMRIKYKAGELKYKITELLRNEFKETGATSEELADYLCQEFDDVQPRTSDLRKLNFIRDSGRKRLNRRGNPCTVWEAV